MIYFDLGYYMKYQSIYIIIMTIICIFFYKKHKKYRWLLIKLFIILSFIFIMLGRILRSYLILIGMTMVILSFLLYISYINREKEGLWIQKNIFLSFIFIILIFIINYSDFWIPRLPFISFAIILIFCNLQPLPNPIKLNFIFSIPFSYYTSYPSEYN